MDYAEERKKQREEARKKLTERQERSRDAVAERLKAAGFTTIRNMGNAVGLRVEIDELKNAWDGSISIRWDHFTAPNSSRYFDSTKGDERLRIIIERNYTNKEVVQGAKDDPNVVGARADRIVDAVKTVLARARTAMAQQKTRDHNTEVSSRVAEECNAMLGELVKKGFSFRQSTSSPEPVFEGKMQLKADVARALAVQLNVFFATLATKNISTNEEEESDG